MRIKGQKIYITEGDSFTIPFELYNEDDGVAAPFDPTDTIIFKIQPYNDECDVIRKELTGISGTEFTIHVDRHESRRLCAGRYEYGVIVKNGSSRLTLLPPTDFIVERGV